MSSGKRGATSDLNHDNWDQEEDKEEAGEFKLAPPDVIKGRVIKHAVRRRTTTAGSISETNDIKNNIFGGLDLKGFAIPKAKANTAFQSFDFLSGNQDKVSTAVPMFSCSNEASDLKTNVFGNLDLKGFETHANTDSTIITVDVLGGNDDKMPPGASSDPCEKLSTESSSNDKNKPKFSAPSSLQSFVEPTFRKYSHLLSKPTMECKKSPDEKKSGRSEEFLQSMMEINKSFSTWITKNLAEDPTSILTRCFKDYIQHVQALFDEEKKLDLDENQLELLKKQELVLNEVVIMNESRGIDPVVQQLAESQHEKVVENN